MLEFKRISSDCVEFQEKRMSTDDFVEMLRGVLKKFGYTAHEEGKYCDDYEEE